MAEEKTEGKETGKYLTRKYLVSNLQNFWNSIKKYIIDQKFADQSYVSGAINNAVDIKVDKVAGKGLSENDFTDVLKDKLNQLPDSAATHLDMGFMSGDDKQQLDDLVENAVTTVDSALSATSEDPVQNKVIKSELDKKVDKETLDPSQVFEEDLIQIENSTGNIILRSKNKDLKHVKLHTENGEIIEKFYISGTSSSGGTETFDTLKSDDFDIEIPNPDGTELPKNAVYKFYVECLEFSNSGKYKPFILIVTRDNDTPEALILDAFKVQ